MIKQEFLTPHLPDRLSAFFAALTEKILQHRLASGVLLAVVVGVVSAGLLSLQIDFSASSFYGSADPERIYLGYYSEAWGDDGLLVLVVDGGGETLLTGPRLRQIEAVRQVVSEHPQVRNTRTLADQKRPKLTFFGVKSVPLLETRPDDAEALKGWQQTVLSDPTLVPGLLSETGDVAAIVVSPAYDTNDMSANYRMLNDLTSILTSFEGVDGLHYAVAGNPSMRGGVIDAILSDQIILVPISATLMVLCLVFMFRSRHGVFVSLLACGVPLIMLMGAMGAVGHDIGLLNQVYFVLIPAIAVADAIHLISRYHEETRAVTLHGSRHTTRTQRKAIVAAMSHMGLACLFTSLTTVIGFLSLGFTEMTVLRNFGLYAALGIFFAYFTVLLIVPLALSMTRRAAPLQTQNDAGWMGRFLRTCAHLSGYHPRKSLLLTSVLVGVALYFGSGVQVEARYSEVLSESHPVSLANTLLDDRLGGVVGLEIDIVGPSGVFSKTETMHRLQSLEQALRQEAGVRTVFGPALLVALLYEQSSGRRVLPDEGDVEGLLKLADLEAGRAVLVNRDRSRARISVRMKDGGGKVVLATADRLNKVAESSLAGSGLTPHLTGTTFVSYRGSNRVTSDLRNSLMGAFLIIAVLIAVLFRSARLGLLSLLPNLIPLIFAYGAMGFMQWRLDTAPAVVFTVALGLAVDSTIHVLARFREEMNAGHSAQESVHRSVMSSGRAIAMTSIILSVGFGVNAFSSFPDNATFGALGSLIVCGAFFGNLIVLPALLTMSFGGVAPKEKRAA